MNRRGIARWRPPALLRSCGRVGGGDVTVWLQPSGGCSWIRRGCLCRIDIEAGYDDLGAGLQRDEHAARCEMWP